MTFVEILVKLTQEYTYTLGVLGILIIDNGDDIGKHSLSYLSRDDKNVKEEKRCTTKEVMDC